MALTQQETKSSHPRFLRDDLVITMPKSSNWDELSNDQKFTSKYDFLKEAYGAQNFFLAHHRDAHDETPATEQIRISNIYATFEFGTPWAGLNNNRRRTVKRLAELRSSVETRGIKRGWEQTSRDKGAEENDMRNTGGLAHIGAGEVAVSRYQKQPKIHHQNHAAVEPEEGLSVRRDRTALQSFSLLSPSKHENSLNESGAHALSTEADRQSFDVLGFLRREEPHPHGVNSKQQPRGAGQLTKSLASFGYTGAENGATIHAPGLIPLSQASRLPAKRPEDSLKRQKENVSKQQIKQPRSASQGLPEPHALDQTVNDELLEASKLQQSSQPSVTSSVSLRDLLTHVVPQAWSREEVIFHQKAAKVEVEAQFDATLNILFTTSVWDTKPLDTQTAEAVRRVRMDFVETEERWMVFHSQVTASEAMNTFGLPDLINRQLECFTIDAGLQRGDVSRLPDAARKVHFADVQREAMSRQLALLKSWTHVKKIFAAGNRSTTLSSRSNDDPVQEVLKEFEKKTASITTASLIIPLPKRVSSLREGLSKPITQTTVLMIDEDTGVASVANAGYSKKRAGTGPTAGKQQNSLKRKQEAKRSTSRKKPRNISTDEETSLSTDEGTSKVSSLHLTKPSQSFPEKSGTASESQIEDDGVGGQAESSFLDWGDIFSTPAMPPPTNGTIDPRMLSLSYQPTAEDIESSFLWRGSFNAPAIPPPTNKTTDPKVLPLSYQHTSEAASYLSQPIGGTELRTRISKVAPISEEERARHLARQRQETEAELASPKGPPQAVGVSDFFYVTPLDFEFPGDDQELEGGEDEIRNHDLDSQGLFKY